MSIEEALLKNAEALTRHSEALNRQSAVLEQIVETGVAFVAVAAQLPDGAATSKPDTTTTTKTLTAAEKKKLEAAKKAAEEKAAADAADSGDGLGDDIEDPFADEGGSDEKVYTAAEVRAAILKVRDKGGEKKNTEGAKKVLTTLGVKSMSEIPDEKFAKAMELCAKALK